MYSLASKRRKTISIESKEKQPASVSRGVNQSSNKLKKESEEIMHVGLVSDHSLYGRLEHNDNVIQMIQGLIDAGAHRHQLQTEEYQKVAPVSLISLHYDIIAFMNDWAGKSMRNFKRLHFVSTRTPEGRPKQGAQFQKSTPLTATLRGETTNDRPFKFKKTLAGQPGITDTLKPNMLHLKQIPVTLPLHILV